MYKKFVQMLVFAILMIVCSAILAACDEEQMAYMIDAANAAAAETVPVVEESATETLQNEAPAPRAPIRISFTQAQSLIYQTENIIIIDVRTPAEFDGGHIENAISLPLNDMQNTIIDAVSDKNQTILIYCQSGNRSQVAMDILYDLGYTVVYELEGGILAWLGNIVR